MNIELLMKAAQVIEDVPEDKLDLRDWQIGMVVARNSEEVTCGTIACAAGWLTLSPVFNELGVYASTHAYPMRRDRWEQSGYEMFAELFEIPYFQAARLFGQRRSYADTDRIEMSDKQVWLTRARELLYAHEHAHAEGT